MIAQYKREHEKEINQALLQSQQEKESLLQKDREEIECIRQEREMLEKEYLEDERLKLEEKKEMLKIITNAKSEEEIKIKMEQKQKRQKVDSLVRKPTETKKPPMRVVEEYRPPLEMYSYPQMPQLSWMAKE